MIVAGHAPFAWGVPIEKAVENAIVLEFAAQMAVYSRMINPDSQKLNRAVLDKHYFRKHGPGAYYGQPIKKNP